ncbi:ATPase AAA [Mesorhizobium sp. LSJC255A00]|uniref:ATPase AAA n=1 Tax=Mesorhizobium sp. LSJC255A00 TaxID=1287313 RepID=UPI0003CECD18|nr:ATPase AAA [Mesorhizobium sp. LSJC255A00]ESX11126.1 ATPase AAA [Mesorhizobium sp. LSJC255A00]
MSLPDIDFKQIRLHGNQADAFEELCCQLASEEASPDRLGFDRKGRGGDAGVECFETLADASEIGWQVKYYWDIDPMLRSLGKSLDTALVKHPRMRKFIACFPFDLADARKDDSETALEKWNTWRADRIKKAVEDGRTMEIERWDAHAIRQRLTGSNPRAAGRVAFWFDQRLLTREWLDTKFARTKAGLGQRYDPERHVDLPIGRAICAVTGDPAFFDELAELGHVIRGAADQASLIAGTPVALACDAAASALHAAALSRAVPASELQDAARTAADAALQLHDELEEANGDTDPSEAMRAVSNLAGRLREVAAMLRQPHWGLLDARSLLVYGDAGSGKSHLLADACAHQLKAGRPALMVLGGTLADAEPWSQILQSLDLPRHLEVSQFLGALNAAGEAAGTRALMAIDAVNEKNGQLIWPERLAGLLYDLAQFPWIAVVLSCRTTYLNVVIPDTLDEAKLPRIKHRGFSVAEVRAYLKQRGMTLPETPLQALEFQTPLFLRLYCDALEFEGEALLARGLGGVSDIFRAYTGAVARRVHRQLKVPPGRNLAEKTLAALAREMADTGRGEITVDRAEAIVRAFHPGRSIEDGLLFQLENEGMLTVEPMLSLSGEPEQAVRFTFERIGDHAIAAVLVERGGVAGLCAPGTPLHMALAAKNSRIVFGLIEALAIQLPERFGIELPDLIGLPGALRPDHPFVQSLQARRLDAISARTWQLVDTFGGAELRYNTLIALATEPGHPYNGRFLYAELRALRMPARDSAWSIHLAQSPEAASHLINWVRSADPRAIAAERAELTAIQLTWFLTATHRPLRDRATKALVVLFADRAALAMEVWRAFSGLDDGYVVERLAAALYGAAMQGRWSKRELRAVAEALHTDLFAGGSPSANVLLRDHAGGLIGYAAERGALPPEFELASTKPPFSSSWPIELISDDQMSAFTVAYKSNRERFRDHIVSSLQDGDFARYILDVVVRRFSPALRGADPLPTARELKDQWLAEFTTGATKEELAAYAALESRMAAITGDGPLYAADRDAFRAIKRAFRDAVGSERFEDWRARAEDWRDEGMYQSFRTRGPAGFNLAWARRWVTWRAHNLGWSEPLHHAFDRSIGSGRSSHEIERIGKKYQWLATYELVARMEDNLAVLPREEETGPDRLRNIDPSMLRERTEDDSWRSPGAASFWAPPRPIVEAATPREALAWLHSDEAIVDGAENIEVTAHDGRQWLALTGFELWSDERDAVRSESWRRIGCTIVRAADRQQLLDLLEGIHMTTRHDMPIAGGDGYYMHLGEHPWAWPDRASAGGWLAEWRPNGVDWEATGLPVRPPTSEYIAESSGYDHSITQNITLNLPAGWLMDTLGLRLSDGRSIEYRNAADEVVFMDPSVARVGRSAALVERTAFFDMLKEEELVAVWAVSGEKSVFGGLHSDGFGGRRVFTRLFVSGGADLEALPRLETIEKPSKRQRAILFGQDAEGLPDDDEDEGVKAEA